MALAAVNSNTKDAQMPGSLFEFFMTFPHATGLGVASLVETSPPCADQLLSKSTHCADFDTDIFLFSAHCGEISIIIIKIVIINYRTEFRVLGNVTLTNLIVPLRIS